MFTFMPYSYPVYVQGCPAIYLLSIYIPSYYMLQSLASIPFSYSRCPKSDIQHIAIKIFVTVSCSLSVQMQC